MRRRPSVLTIMFVVLSSLWLGLGCAQLAPGASGMPCPVSWAPPPAPQIGDASSMRAHVQLRVRDEEIRFELISESRDSGRIVVGLAQYGVRLFAIRQRDREVVVEAASTSELEHVALWIMDALHRAYWIQPPEGSPSADWEWGHEHVRDFDGDEGRRREFMLPGSSSTAGRVSIEYADSDSDGAEDAASIRNPWCGYEAVIAPIRAISDPPSPESSF